MLFCKGLQCSQQQHFSEHMLRVNMSSVLNIVSFVQLCHNLLKWTHTRIYFRGVCSCFSHPLPPASLSFSQWATVTFHLPHHVLKLVASNVVNELKKINQNVAALSVASSIMDRLSYLLSSARPELGVGPGRSVDRWVSRKTTHTIYLVYFSQSVS